MLAHLDIKGIKDIKDIQVCVTMSLFAPCSRITALVFANESKLVSPQCSFVPLN